MFDSLFAVFEYFLTTFGYAALFFIVFAESGLFFGFFFPGDSLLFAAGLLSSQGVFRIEWVLPLIAIAAILGDQAGYWTGAKFGRQLFNKPKSVFFNPKHITDAEAFYAKHGKKTIVLARFVPAVRTFAPIVAGMAKMDHATFTTYNILGGILWTLIFVFAGFFLGHLIPNAGDYITIVIAVIIALSLIPIAFEVLKRKKNSESASR